MKERLLFSILFFPVLAFAQTYTYSTLVSFPATSAKSAVNPYAPIIDASGKLYGVSEYGGVNNLGTVFKVTPKGVLSVLYSFGASPTDAARPKGTLIRDSSGNVYGIAGGGGADAWGTIFKLTSANKLKILYVLPEFFSPVPPLVRDKAGNLYGLDADKGEAGWVFELTSSGTYKILHDFCSDSACIDGSNPTAGLILDRAGNLTGATWFGGAFDQGVVFKMTPSGVESVIYSFTGGTDGRYPTEKLTQDAAGNMYGVAYKGGAYDYGTVFKITPDGTETTLHSFTGGSDGNVLASPVILDSTGNVYGIASGGTKGHGIVYKITPSGDTTVIYEAGPVGLGSGLAMDKLGNLYGTTWSGGAHRTGSVYKLTKH
jgi:uncharacterized repeat protein (TIGR03803 family)